MRHTLMLLVMAGLLCHCSVYKAVTAKKTLALDRVRVGAPRTEIVSILGSPASIEAVSDGRVETYEFEQGNTGASKLRIFPYLFADFFTIGFAELLLWPLELTMPKPTLGRAVVTYTPDDMAHAVLITSRDGQPWRQK